MNYKKFSLLFGIFALFLTQLLIAQSHNHAPISPQEQYSKVKIYTDLEGLSELSALGVEIDHGSYRKGVWFESDFSTSDIERIKNAGFTYEIIHEDVVAYYMSKERQEAQPHNHLLQKATGCSSTSGGIGTYPVPRDFQLGSMGGFFTYGEMLTHLDNMTEKYPDLITARTAIGEFKTHDGNEVYSLKISDNPNKNELEPEVLYTALHHAREPMSLSQMIYYMYYILENYETDESIKFLVDNTEMYFVPCINPDGYIYNELSRPNGGGMWRRNTRDNDDNGAFSPQADGVDLNRNYDHEWGRDDVGSSPDPTRDTYRGPASASEPEVQAMQFFCENHDFKIAFNYHAFSDLLIYPWGYVPDFYTPDSALFVNYAQIMTKENEYFYGTANQTVGYTVNGDSDDWMYGEESTKNKTFAFTPEVGNSEDGFWPSSNRIIPLCQANMWANLSMASLVHNMGRIEDKTPLYLTSNQSDFTFELTRLGLSDGIPLTVSVEAINDAIVSVGEAQSLLLESPLSISPVNISYELRADLEAGASVEFDILLDNHQGTVQRISVGKFFGTPAITLEDNLDDMEAWSSNQWGLSNTEFFSSNSSLADSPAGQYFANSDNQLTLNETLDLTDCEIATLTFWAKWDIEANFDYVQLHAIDTESGTETPLCGDYTKMGNSYLGDDQPLYDGIQSAWVQEEISLHDFIGQKISLRFTFWSDQFVERDGFYLDDLQVVKLGGDFGTSIADIQFNSEMVLSQNVPNPATGTTTFSFKVPSNLETFDLVTYNAFGQEINRQSSITENKGGLAVNLETLHTGVYYSRLESAKGTSNVVRLLIVR